MNSANGSISYSVSCIQLDELNCLDWNNLAMCQSAISGEVRAADGVPAVDVIPAVGVVQIVDVDRIVGGFRGMKMVFSMRLLNFLVDYNVSKEVRLPKS